MVEVGNSWSVLWVSAAVKLPREFVGGVEIFDCLLPPAGLREVAAAGRAVVDVLDDPSWITH